MNNSSLWGTTEGVSSMKSIVRSLGVAGAVLGASAMPSFALSLTTSPTPCAISSSGSCTFQDSAIILGISPDTVAFTLSVASSFTADASATNSLNLISHWGMALYLGAPPPPGGGLLETAILTAVPGSQELDLTAPSLGPGAYFLQITGDSCIICSYGGDVSAAAVPGPTVGAGLPGLISAGGFLFAWLRNRRTSRDASTLAAA
jgi:hypothetical protein